MVGFEHVIFKDIDSSSRSDEGMGLFFIISVSSINQILKRSVHNLGNSNTNNCNLIRRKIKILFFLTYNLFNFI